MNFFERQAQARRTSTRLLVLFALAVVGIVLAVDAAVWLASTLAAMGDPLREGDIVLTGALGPMAVAAPGSSFEARISGLGGVRVGFAPAEAPFGAQADKENEQ